jgi:prophage antirepressor-like protein
MKNYKSEQVMTLQVTEGLSVAIIQDKAHEFLMTTKDVAEGYGVSVTTIRRQKMEHKNELLENKHFIYGVQELNGANINKVLYWTKRGIVRLGFFIKSSNAKFFRDWAEDLIIDKLRTNIIRKRQLISLGHKFIKRVAVRYIETNEFWYSINDLQRALGYKVQNSTHTLKRAGKLNAVRYIAADNSEQWEWYINRQGVKNVLFSSQKSLDYEIIRSVYLNLLGEQLPQQEILPFDKEIFAKQKELMELIITAKDEAVRKRLYSIFKYLEKIGGQNND